MGSIKTIRARAQLVVVALAVAVAGALTPVGTASAQEPPDFTADISYDVVAGWGWTPSSLVGVVVKSSPTGEQLYQGSAGSDGEGSFAVRDIGETVDLVPGMYVQVSDGTLMKDLVLADIAITEIDPATDTVRGTAPYGPVDLNIEQGDTYYGGTAAFADGQWSYTFTDYDVTPRTEVCANAFEPDADGTGVCRQLFGGWVEVNWSFGTWGTDFTPSSAATVRVYKSVGGRLIGEQTVTIDEEGRFDVDLGELAPGRLVTATDEATGFVKEVLVVPLSIDSMDAASNVVTGTAPPSTTFNLDANVGSDEEQQWMAMDVTSDRSGAWTADFDTIGVDLEPGMQVGVNINDDDGDSVAADSYVAQGFVTARVGGDWITGEMFDPGAPLVVEVLTGDTLLLRKRLSADGDGWFSIGTGVVLTPGTLVRVRDEESGLVKELDVARLEIRTVDPATDIVTGVAGSLAEFEVHVADLHPGVPDLAEADLYVTAAADGSWVADFGAVGFDITDWPWIQVGARAGDGDGDTTDAEYRPAYVSGDLALDTVGGQLTAGVNATVQIRSGTDQLLYEGTVRTGMDGMFTLARKVHRIDLASGMLVRLTSGTVVREVTLVALTIDEFVVDVAAPYATGTAPDGTEVWAGWSFGDKYGGYGDAVEVTAVGGQWTVDFHAVGTYPPAGSAGGAQVRDQEGDWTIATYVAPKARK